MTRQVTVTAFDGERGLRVVEVEEPHAGPRQVRVRVAAAGLNPVDLRIAEGGASAARFGVDVPYVNGNDFAGSIDEVGDGVTGWSIGDRVYGGARCRAQTEHLVIDDFDTLIRTPDGLPDEQAAVLDIAARTAWAGVEALRIQRGETVLVTAATGGVGLLAAQLARLRGARVLGVAGLESAEILSGLGVEPVDYAGDLPARLRQLAPEGIAAVFDTHGGGYIQLAVDLGVPVSRINSVGDRAGAEAVGALTAGRQVTSPQALEPLGRMVATGELAVRIDGVYPIAEVREAYRRLADGHVHGKLVLDLTA